MPDITKEFIRDIPLEKYLKDAEDRKIVIWGKGSIGEKIIDILQDKGYTVSYVIDRQCNDSSSKQTFCGIEVKSPDYLQAEKVKVYCIVAIRQYRPEIEDYFQEIGYEEIADYLFLFHKPMVVKQEQPYVDLYGNTITGKAGTVVSVTAYDSRLELYSNVDSNFGLYVCNSCLSIDEHVSFSCINQGAERSLYCFKGSKIQVNADVCFPDSFWVECYDNSTICIDKGVELKDRCTLSCHENSQIALGAEGRFGALFSAASYHDSRIQIGKGMESTERGGLHCFDDSEIVIGNGFHLGRDSGVTSRKQSSVRIGDNCSVEWFFICACAYEGTVVIGDRFMGSHYVSVFNNDTHPIFDVKTSKRVNRDRKIIISEHVWAGIKSTILSGAEIGESCIIGANSVVTKHFPNNCSIGGAPARILNRDMTWDGKEEDINNINPKYIRFTEEEEE